MFLFLLIVLGFVHALREYRLETALESALKTERMRQQKTDDSTCVPA